MSQRYSSGVKLGVIGCGQMGIALAAGAVRAGVVSKENLFGLSRSETGKERFVSQSGGSICQDLKTLTDSCDVLLLCIKPKDAAEFLQGFPMNWEGLLVSVVAGLSLRDLQGDAQDHLRVARAMPNTPVRIGHGASAYCVKPGLSEEDCQVIESLLGGVGFCVKVNEGEMNAVTGVSGSGPAFIFLVIEAMADGAVRAGLRRDVALKLAAHTVSGASEMVLQSDEHPAILKDQVTSPGGTTIAGLAKLEETGVRAAFIAAVDAAAKRAVELGSR